MEERVMAQEPSPAELPVAQATGVVHASEAHAGTEVAHGGEGGLPQLKFEYWGGQILWLLILFAIFYVLVARVFTPRLRKVMDDRSASISGAIAEARRAQAEAEAQATKGKAEIAEARTQSQRIALEAKAKSKAESDARLAKEEAALSVQLDEAEVRIRSSRDQAMTQVEGIAVETAQAMVAKLAGPVTAAELATARAAA